MKLLVCGGRDYCDLRFVKRTLDQINDRLSIDLLIQGGARGADTLAANWAKHRGVKCVCIMAEWEKYGRSAGHIRNQRMLDEYSPDGFVAFPGGRGTADMIRKALKAGVTRFLATPSA